MPQRNQKLLIALALVLLGGLLLFVVFDRPPALPAVTFLPPGPLAGKSGRVPDRWIPAKWTWLHRTCLFVFGPLRRVGFNVQFKETSGTVTSVVARNSLGQPQAESNGLAVWIVPDEMLRRPKDTATILFAPRAITFDRNEARVMTGGNAASHSVNLFARLEKEAVDLSTRLIFISGGQTNLAVAVRAQLPDGQALFVLDVRQPESATNRYEFLITADEYDAKGNKVHHHP